MSSENPSLSLTSLRGRDLTMASEQSEHRNLFSSLVSDIKSYTGQDPLLPWLRGIKKMQEVLPPHILNEKLPRFLQRCTQSFESDRRYRDDLRYIRIWLQLMDFVDDPKLLLRAMEVNQIGTKRSLFYQAYALYYEKIKKFDEAEKMYRLGVQNLAEPIDDLQKSYEQFLSRMERHKKKRIQQQERRTARQALSVRNIPLQCNMTREKSEKTYTNEDRPAGVWDQESLPNGKNIKTNKTLEESSQRLKPLVESNHIQGPENLHNVGRGNNPSIEKDIIANGDHVSISKKHKIMEGELDEPRIVGSDDTVVVKFVGTAIVGKSEAEAACHHGLVDPTINMKEAMNAINSMFREPIETAPAGRGSNRRQKKEDHSLNTGFEVFVDESLNSGINSVVQPEQLLRAPKCHAEEEPFKIYIDDDDKDDSEENAVGDSAEGPASPAFVFLNPKDFPSESSSNMAAETLPQSTFREDTVVHRFVGSTISEEPEVENVCHHGLVDPTVNLKEAMENINNMFGKPIDFVRASRSKKQEKEQVRKPDLGGFSILPDDELEPRSQLPPKSSHKSSDCDLFEPTMFTKEAMDDINKMFGMPLGF